MPRSKKSCQVIREEMRKKMKLLISMPISAKKTLHMLQKVD